MLLASLLGCDRGMSPDGLGRNQNILVCLGSQLNCQGKTRYLYCQSGQMDQTVNLTAYAFVDIPHD
jgi:hypothetical protein